MMRRLLFAAALLAGVSGAAAQPVVLRPFPAEGRFVQVTTTDVTVEVVVATTSLSYVDGFGTRVDTTTVQVHAELVATHDVTAEADTHHVRVTFDRFQLRTEQAGQAPVVYDSDTAEGADEVFAPWKAGTFHYVALDTTVRLVNRNDLLDAYLARAEVGDNTYLRQYHKGVFARVLAERPPAEVFRFTLGAFPARPVSVGDTLPYALVLDLSNQVTAQVQSAITLERLEGTTARLGGPFTVTGIISPVAGGSKVMLDGTGTMQQRFDLRTGAYFVETDFTMEGGESETDPQSDTSVEARLVTTVRQTETYQPES